MLSSKKENRISENFHGFIYKVLSSLYKCEMIVRLTGRPLIKKSKVGYATGVPLCL